MSGRAVLTRDTPGQLDCTPATPPRGEELPLHATGLPHHHPEAALAGQQQEGEIKDQGAITGIINWL